jgi:hypothetical protein
MQSGTDLTVHLQTDRPEALVTALEALGRTGINVDGLTEFDGLLHLLTRDAPGAMRALRSAGVRVRGEQPVAIVDVPDRPGTAAAVLRRVSDAGVSVAFCYLATSTRLVIGAEDPKEIAKILAE